MSAAVGTVIEARSAQASRREHILDAAETCFVRNGFHRTTMQDLAREAAMSPGNIYRYFESKEAVVHGLAEREHDRAAAIIDAMERSGSRRGALYGLLERYFLDLPREAAVLRLDLWAEATRNSGIAAIVARREEEGRLWFIETLAAIATSPDCDPGGLFETINPLMKGIIVSRALLPDYDPKAAVAQLHALIDAGLAGRLPGAALSDGEPRS